MMRYKSFSADKIGGVVVEMVNIFKRRGSILFKQEGLA